MLLSRRFFAALAVSTTALFILLITVSDRLRDLSGITKYYNQSPHRSQYAPKGSFRSRPPVVNGSAIAPPPHRNLDRVCDGFPDTSKVLLVMKTGASEAFKRVPTQLITMLKCLPDFLIFSDLDQDIGGYRVFDSLENVLSTVKEGNGDFDLYRRQKACLVDIEYCNKFGNAASEGWSLDKYKNLHIAEMSYTMRPGYDWYLFVDADTYVLFPNMVEWLSKLNPRKKLYLGSVTFMGGFPFGHGGSGYVASHAAMADLVGKHPGIANDYDARASRECCGDFVFGLAMKEVARVEVDQVWPTINGEKPSTLPFGPGHWCQPIVTMHHMNSQEIDDFWRFERSWHDRQPYRPLLIRDIYDRYLAPKMQTRRVDWDNRSDDRFYFNASDWTRTWEGKVTERTKDSGKYNEFEKKAHLSSDDCEAACKSVGTSECFQWKYQDALCSFSKSFMLGNPVKPSTEDSTRVVSGWHVEKIKGWIEKEGKCDHIRWPKVKG